MVESFATVVAGLGLFFAGLWFLTESLKKLEGRRLRDALTVGIGRPWRGFTWGLIAGGLTHTATVTVFILTSLLAAGLTTLKATVPVLLGVNIGTSALVFLATLDIETVALIITGVAGIAIASEKAAGLRPVISAVFGIGMLFVGIGMLQDGATDVVQQAWAERFLSANRDSYLIGFLAGATLRFVTQSASAVTILAITLSDTSVIGIEQTVMTIYGANFGAAISTWALSWGVRGHPRQIAMYQVIFDVLGAVILVPLFYLEVYGGVPLVQALVISLADDVQQQMALVFLLFNVTAALALAAMMPVMTFASRWWSDRSVAAEAMLHSWAATVPPAHAPAARASERRRAQAWPIAMGAVASVVLAVGVVELSRSGPGLLRPVGGGPVNQTPKDASALVPAFEVKTALGEETVTTLLQMRSIAIADHEPEGTHPAYTRRTLQGLAMHVPASPVLGGDAQPEDSETRDAGVPLIGDAGSGDDILALLERADADLVALRLTTPPGDSAWDRFRTVLSRDPNNTQAQQGLRLIVARYVELAKDAEAAGRYRRAAIFLSRSRAVLFGYAESELRLDVAERTGLAVLPRRR